MFTTYSRVNVSLVPGDTVYVAQYRGPRLPEGATTLPDGASIVFLRVDILPLGPFSVHRPPETLGHH